ncbi:glycosyl hydrolase family 88 [Enterococcus sp. JM9B]|nr:glycosyl hydrolase family 88 [Enterococcus sp. JM9B]
MNILDSYIDNLVEESSPQKPLWNMEKILVDAKGSWNYIDGCMLKSLIDLYEITQDKKYYYFVKQFIDFYVDREGTIKTYDPLAFNLDNINEGRALLYLYKKTKHKRYLLALKELYRQLEFQPRTKAGSFWHMLKFPYQVWLDGLYMTQPYYLEYDLMFNNGQNISDIMNQFRNVYSTNRDSKTGLYYHGYDETKWMFWADKETGRSSEFWLRALGWYLMSLVECCELFDGKYMAEREELQTVLTDLVDALVYYQDDKTGMWYQIIDKGELVPNYLETSGSAILAYGIMKSVRLGLLDERYRHYGEQAFYGICDKYLNEKDGKLILGGICIMAGLGEIPEQNGKFEYYMSEKIVENEAKGVAPLIMAYTEILRR